MVKTLPLNESASVLLNAFGDGTARVGPVGHGVTWQPQVVSVKVTPPVTNEATCAIYVGSSVAPENFIDNTYTGSSGDSSGNVGAMGAQIRMGSYVWAVWTHGDVGAQATVTVTGSLMLDG